SHRPAVVCVSQEGVSNRLNRRQTMFVNLGSNLGRLAAVMSLLGIVALPACSPRGRSLGEGSVQTKTSALGTSPATWRQEGPTPLTNCGVHALPFDDCTGAAQQPVVDPTNGAIYLATVNGGIFK